MSATIASGFAFGLRFLGAFFAPPFADLRPFPFFAGHFMLRHRIHGGRPREITLMMGCPHALHRSSVGTMSPRCGSGSELSHFGEVEQPTNRLPYVPLRTLSSPSAP